MAWREKGERIPWWAECVQHLPCCTHWTHGNPCPLSWRRAPHCTHWTHGETLALYLEGDHPVTGVSSTPKCSEHDGGTVSPPSDPKGITSEKDSDEYTEPFVPNWLYLVVLSCLQVRKIVLGLRFDIRIIMNKKHINWRDESHCQERNPGCLSTGKNSSVLERSC